MAASSISDWIEEQLDCCISSWAKRDLVQVLFNDRDHLESPDVTQAGLEGDLELLQLLPVQDLLLSQSVQQLVPEKFLNQLNPCYPGTYLSEDCFCILRSWLFNWFISDLCKISF